MIWAPRPIMNCHQILSGACNAGDRCYAVGSVEGISFTVSFSSIPASSHSFRAFRVCQPTTCGVSKASVKSLRVTAYEQRIKSILARLAFLGSQLIKRHSFYTCENHFASTSFDADACFCIDVLCVSVVVLNTWHLLNYSQTHRIILWLRNRNSRFNRFGPPLNFQYKCIFIYLLGSGIT